MNKSNFLSISPSRRPCIKGPGCQRECCTMSNNNSNSTRRSLPLEDDHDTSRNDHSNSSQNDYRNYISTDDSGEDTVDGEVLVNRPKPSSYVTSQYNVGEIESRKRNIQTKKISKTYDFEQPIRNQPVSRSIQLDTKIIKDHQNYPNDERPVMNQSVNKVWLLLIGGVIVMSLLYYVQVLFSGSVISSYTQNDFKREMKAIGNKYKINRDAMLHIQNGIESTFREQDTVSIMLLYREMKENILSEFVNKVANASAKYLRTGAGNPIILKQSDLKMQSQQELIDKYRGDLESQGVVLFQNLEKIPLNLVKAFHYYCDEHNPLAKKTAVFFTLDLAKCKEYFNKDKVEVVEICLREKWKTMNTDDLMPLISRVINVVVDLEGSGR